MAADDGYIRDPRVPDGTEDIENGLYLPRTAPVLTMSQDGVTTVYVPAATFMEVQRERDEYRRVVALINAWRIEPDRSEHGLRQLLARVGQGDAEASATQDILRWVQSEQMARQVRGEE